MAMTQKDRKAMNAGLAAAMRRKIGRTCWFRHPETGKVIQGVYKRGRKVVELTGITLPKETKDIHAPREYNFNETTWTVPRHVHISFGSAPIDAVK